MRVKRRGGRGGAAVGDEGVNATHLCVAGAEANEQVVQEAAGAVLWVVDSRDQLVERGGVGRGGGGVRCIHVTGYSCRGASRLWWGAS